MKHLVFGLLVAAAVVAHADSYLYWMVGDNTGYDYTSARLVASSESTWSWAANANVLDTATKSTLDEAKGFADGIYSSIGNFKDGQTYFIELVADTGVLAYSDGLSYANAAQYLSSLTQFDPGAASLWTASSFTAVPEPTSGMMMLLGVAALALRRRRRV